MSVRIAYVLALALSVCFAGQLSAASFLREEFRVVGAAL